MSLPRPSAYRAAYRATHREQIRAYRAAYRATHREELRAYDAACTAAYMAAHRGSRENVDLYDAVTRGAIGTRLMAGELMRGERDDELLMPDPIRMEAARLMQLRDADLSDISLEADNAEEWE